MLDRVWKKSESTLARGFKKVKNEKLNENYSVLTNLVVRAAEIRSCKGYFPQEQHLSCFVIDLSSIVKVNNPSLGPSTGH